MRKVHSAAIAALVVMLAGALDLPAKDAADAGPLTTENFFERLNKHPSAFGAFLFFTSREVQDNPELRGYAAQMLATNYSFLGRPNDAIREFPIHNLEPAPADLPDRATHRAVSAVEWIAARSRQYQVVMVNEAHHKPQTRLLTLALLPELRTLGFKYLAAETFAEDPLKAGYPSRHSGYYTREPIFAEIMREAARLGFELIPYEATGEALNASQQSRETAQAKRIAEVLVRDPAARILVHAGYGHISKHARTQPGSADPMAVEFMQATGLPILSVDQTKLTWEDGQAAERLAQAFGIAVPSILLDRKNETAWSPNPERYDASVVLPSASPDTLRPDWLELGGTRQPVVVDMAPCIGHLPCLVAARYASEDGDAIPADQFVMIDPTEVATPLYLAPGQYQLQLVGNDGNALLERKLDVPPVPASTPESKATQ